jgi:adenylate cyclase
MTSTGAPSRFRAHLGGLGAALAVGALVVAGGFEPVEHWSLGRLFELRGSRAPAVPVTIVTIDESTFAELGVQWPFPRAMHGELLRKISAGRPRAIGVDLLFDAPSARGPADDEALSRAVAEAGNVVLGAAWAMDVQPGMVRGTCNFPLPEIRAGAAAVALVNLAADDDGAVRRASLGFTCGRQRVSAMAVELHRLATASGLPTTPLPTTAEALINFRGGPRTFPWVSYYRVYRDEVGPELFRDQIVLIGTTSEVMHDLYPSPFAAAGDMPGVEIHANALATFIRGNRIHEVPRSASAALAVAAALAGSTLVVRLQAARALAGAALLGGALAALAIAGFLASDVWVRVMAPACALLLGYGATVVEGFVREQRERRRLSQFFSPEVLREVVRQRRAGALESSRRLITVLFSDIRGFTAIAEKLAPEDVAEMLREYLSEMTEVVFAHGGTVDKYVGDCVMALYNAPFADPDHAVQAVRTALEFQERTLALSARWEARFGASIRIGVGINTGEAVVGTLGSRQRLEYTAIGDTVNLAARLESLTKDYGVSIIVSEFTWRLVKGRFTTRALGAVTVRGRSQPVDIHAVLPSSLRRHPRAVLDGATAVLTAADGRSCRAEAVNVGGGGLAVSGVPPDWTAGLEIEVRCEGGTLSDPIATRGRIVWRREDRAGIAFVPSEPPAGRADAPPDAAALGAGEA